MQFVLTRHARMRATQRLGVCPPDSWWAALAQRINDGEVELTSIQLGRPNWLVPCVAADGTEVDLCVITAAEDYISFVTVYLLRVNGQDVREDEQLRELGWTW